MIQLYEFALSGNCHKARLLLSLLGLSYQSVIVQGAAREHKAADFLALNPFGQVPVLKDGEIIVRDSQAILVYLASRYGGAAWWPQEPAAQAAIAAWLSTCANEVARGPAALRKQKKFGGSSSAEAPAITLQLLAAVNTRLTAQPWIATDTLSIADIALYPYLALAHEAEVDLNPYPAIQAWLRRIQALPGYLGMPGM